MRCKKARKNISLALDSRRPAVRLEDLRSHLQGCTACRDWQNEQQEILQLMQAASVLDHQPSPQFYAALQDRIKEPVDLEGHSTFFPLLSRPLLRAAMFMLLLFSAVAGFVLGGRLDARTVHSVAADFNQAMNLDAFSDLPAGSFGAVYEGLLQGGLQ